MVWCRVEKFDVLKVVVLIWIFIIVCNLYIDYFCKVVRFSWFDEYDFYLKLVVEF